MAAKSRGPEAHKISSEWVSMVAGRTRVANLTTVVWEYGLNCSPQKAKNVSNAGLVPSPGVGSFSNKDNEFQ